MIPKEVKIGAITYKIVLDKKLSNRTGLLGEVDYLTATIRIQANTPKALMSIQRQKEILCHEIVHLLFYQIEEHELCGNEDLVGRLGQVLHQVLKDNKLKF